MLMGRLRVLSFEPTGSRKLSDSHGDRCAWRWLVAFAGGGLKVVWGPWGAQCSVGRAPCQAFTSLDRKALPTYRNLWLFVLFGNRDRPIEGLLRGVATKCRNLFCFSICALDDAMLPHVR
jgi:hypothetical protein